MNTAPASATRCTNSACRRSTLPTWAFCCSCGEDLRMPAHRRPVPPCEDHTIIDGEFCIDCGHSILDAPEHGEDVDDIRWKVIASWVGLVVGGLAFGFGQMVLAAREGKAGPFTAALRSISMPDKNNPDYVPIGMTLAYWGVRLGCLLAIASIFMLIVLPTVKKRRYLG